MCLVYIVFLANKTNDEVFLWMRPRPTMQGLQAVIMNCIFFFTDKGKVFDSLIISFFKEFGKPSSLILNQMTHNC